MDLYKNSFENFLKCTDEKKVFISEILKCIKGIDAKSMLDIGAGNGSLAIPLSKEVPVYVAVEKNESFAKNLAENGLQVFSKEFPGQFKTIFLYDLVLCSYVLPHTVDFRRFVDKAIACAGPGCFVLFITHARSKDEWGRFCTKNGFANLWDTLDFMQSFIQYLQMAGKVRTKIVQTTIRSSDFAHFASAMYFIATGGEAKYEHHFEKQKFETALKSYQSNGEYVFELEHHFILYQKG